MPYLTPDTAVTGGFITAADGNRRRDNDEYLKGRAGLVSIENAVAVSGQLSASSTISTPTVVQAGPGAINNLTWHDRSTNQPWVLYAGGGFSRLYTPTGLEPLQVGVAGNMVWSDVIDNGLPPGRLSQSALTGFLRAGTWTYTYNGDGTIASQAMSAAGPLNGAAITYEYSGGRVSAQRLRLGGTGGTVIASITYGYDGAGRVSTEAHA